MERGKRIQSVIQLIEASGHRCALVASVAVSTRARERFTNDIDFAVAVNSDAEAEALALAFQQADYSLRRCSRAPRRVACDAAVHGPGLVEENRNST